MSGTASSEALTATWFGRVDYGAAWTLQREVFAARHEDRCGDCLLLVEHPPTYTLGRRGLEDDLVFTEGERAARGIATYRVDRGGRATYHGPGQLVGYPIMALGRRYDVITYLRNIEEALLRTVADLGITGERDAEHTGVWVGEEKIAAIGVKVTRGITMHGFALNVSTDLSLFSGIVPCGIADRGVTSIQAQRGSAPSVQEGAAMTAGHFADVVGRALVWAHPSALASVATTVPRERDEAVLVPAAG